MWDSRQEVTSGEIEKVTSGDIVIDIMALTNSTPYLATLRGPLAAQAGAARSGQALEAPALVAAPASLRWRHQTGQAADTHKFVSKALFIFRAPRRTRQ